MIGDPLAPPRYRDSYLDDVRFKNEQKRLLWRAALALVVAALIWTAATSPSGTEGRTWDDYNEQLP